MIQMTHVYKTFPNQISALSDITLEVFPGEFVFIAGSSGSGKTTLLENPLLCGKANPRRGDGQRVFILPKKALVRFTN